MKKISNYLFLLLYVAATFCFNLPAYGSYSNVCIDDNHIDDVCIVSRFDEMLKHTPIVQPTVIYITSKQGYVTLSGIANTASQAKKIIALAKSIKGVKTIDTTNLLIKNGSVSSTDIRIISTIDRMMKADELLKNTKLYAISKHGYVELMGQVDTQAQAERITTLAHSIKEVKEVGIASLHLKNTTTPLIILLGDKYINAKIKGALIRDKLSDPNHPDVFCKIKVQVHNNIACLSGCANGATQMRKVISSVKTVKGVEKIVNNMSISTKY